jgi:hypothetical protein
MTFASIKKKNCFIPMKIHKSQIMC